MLWLPIFPRRTTVLRWRRQHWPRCWAAVRTGSGSRPRMKGLPGAISELEMPRFKNKKADPKVGFFASKDGNDYFFIASLAAAGAAAAAAAGAAAAAAAGAAAAAAAGAAAAAAAGAAAAAAAGAAAAAAAVSAGFGASAAGFGASTFGGSTGFGASVLPQADTARARRAATRRDCFI